MRKKPSELDVYLGLTDRGIQPQPLPHRYQVDITASVSYCVSKQPLTYAREQGTQPQPLPHRYQVDTTASILSRSNQPLTHTRFR